MVGGWWVGGEAAERRRPGWWLPAVGPGPGRGSGAGEVREGGDAPVAGGRRAWSRQRRHLRWREPPETGRAAAVAGANSGGVAVVEPRKKMARWA